MTSLSPCRRSVTLVALIALLWLWGPASATAESSLNASHPHHHSNSIRQCTCSEIDVCWREMHDEMRPCIERCRKSFVLPTQSNRSGVFGCFDEAHHLLDACRERSVHQFCSPSRKHNYIQLNETITQATTNLAARWRHIHSPIISRSHATGVTIFLENNFGDQGMKHVVCIRECFKRRRRAHCLKRMACGLGLPPAHLPELTCEGDQAQEWRRSRACACLQPVIGKPIVCEFTKHVETGKMNASSSRPEKANGTS